MKYITDGRERIYDAEIIGEKSKPNKTTEILDDISDEPTMTLSRTRRYAKLLCDRPAAEVVNEVKQQVTVIIMLINELTIRWIEKLEKSHTADERSHAHLMLANLRAAAAGVAEDKNKLVAAIGINQDDLQTDASGNVVGLKPQTTKLTPEMFDASFGNALDPFSKNDRSNTVVGAAADKLAD